MDQAIAKIGLPVRCRKCRVRGFIIPGSDYGGWFKSMLFTRPHLRWYCPEHYEIGKAVDTRFNEIHVEVPVDTTEEELYALLD
jgi:hypothetical protein